MSIDPLLTEAMAKHQAGDLKIAEILYKEILSIDPKNPDVLNLLGVISLQSNRLQEASRLIRKAIVIDPTIAEYHYNLGEVLLHKGDDKAAIAYFRKSLEINPKLEIANQKLISLGACAQVESREIGKRFKRYEVVQSVIDTIDAKTYLEIGVNSGESFVNISAERKYGVDPVPTADLIRKLLENCGISYFKFASDGSTDGIEIAFNGTNKLPANMPFNNKSEFYYETSDYFFENHAPSLFLESSIDVAFIDGLHTYHQSYNDVVNALDFISSGGFILMHDCNPPTEAVAYPAHSLEEAAGLNIPGWTGQWCGDVWKSIVRLRSTRDDLRVFVLDCDFGIGVIYRGKPEEKLDISVPEIENMTYKDLQENRIQLLNLKPQNYLYEFLQTLL